MAAPLLATKLFIPRTIPGLVARPRLLSQLEGILKTRLTLVSAPAGFGKTTIISEWVRQNQPTLPASWLSLEESENEPVRFWEYFIAALRTVQAGVGETSLALLHSSEHVPIESALVPLINDVTVISKDFVLVLDDYHFVKDQIIHQGLTFFLEHMPPCIHLVITTRVDPPLPMARFRGKGILLEIGAGDLRFSLEEVTNLFAELDAPILSPENMSALHSKTEGWVAGLKMAIFSMRGEKDIPAFIDSFTGSQRYIMDYLIEEVLQGQPPEVNDFLLNTSVLERLSGPLCDAVTGYNNSHEILLRLEHENLFAVPLDKSHEWYRYEHLFADLLRHRLELKSGKEKARELQKKASRWHDQNGLKEKAIDYALAAHDWERALDLILNLTPNLINTYGAFATYSWLRLIPQDLLLTRQRAWRYYVYALAYTGNFDVANTFLDHVEKAKADSVEQTGYIAASRSEIAFYHGDKRAEEYARKALSLLPEDEILQRAVISNQLGVHYMYDGRMGKAELLLAEAYALFLQDNNNVSAGFNLAFQATIALLRGKLHQAEEMCKKAIHIAGQYMASPGEHVVLGQVYYEWNDLANAATEFEKAIKLSVGSPVMMAGTTLVSIPTRLAQGDIQAAVEILEEAGRLWDEGSSVRDRANIAGHRVAVAEALGDNEAVSRWLDKFCEYDSFVSTIPTSTIRLLHQRSSEASDRRLKSLYEACHRENLQYYLILERISQAAISSNSKESLSLLGDALAVGKPEGFTRIFVDWGISLAPLLRQAIAHGIEPGYARKLLDIIETVDRQHRISRGDKTSLPATSGLLSEREMEVLRLVAQGLSNRQIADRLFVAPGTIKAHIYNFTKKLNAINRTQAVERARELKLL